MIELSRAIETGGVEHRDPTQPVILLVGPAAAAAWDAEADATQPSLALRVGEPAQIEFENSVDRLLAVRQADLAAAIEWIEREHVEPTVIVIGQVWPGEIGHAELARLRQAAPLARLCGLLGSWCEGEMRSGRPWPGAWRVLDHQWPQRGNRQLAALAAAGGSVWNLPVTATAEEQLLHEIQLPVGGSTRRASAGGKRGTVVAVAAVADMGGALADACRSIGFEAVVWRDLPGETHESPLAAAAVLWDARAEEAGRSELVERLRRATEGAAVVALLGFPRPDEIERATAAGVAAVVSKPFLLADLAWQLDRVARRD
ncbi:MAG TPA: hypothetical protein VMF30_19180 [Pirellulales bacterium]|nr:hypothetical protein [Pirellulales bacterium]